MALRGGAGEKPPRAGRRSAPGWPSRLVRWPKVRYSVGVGPGAADSPVRKGAARLRGRRDGGGGLGRVVGAVPAGGGVVCLVDDEQWLDHAAAQILAFVARRLGAEAVGLVFGARVPSGDLAGLPELVVGGLREDDARALLGSVLTGPMDERVRDQIGAETRGNPLALLELPRGLTAAELAGGFGLPGALPLPRRTGETFRRRVAALPAQTPLLLLLAAAAPTGDPVLRWRAARRPRGCARAAGA